MRNTNSEQHKKGKRVYSFKRSSHTNFSGRTCPDGARTPVPLRIKSERNKRRKKRRRNNEATTGITTPPSDARGGNAQQPRRPPPSFLLDGKKNRKQIAPTSGGSPSLLSLFLRARQLPPLPLPPPPFSVSQRPQQQGRPLPLCPLPPPAWPPARPPYLWLDFRRRRRTLCPTWRHAPSTGLAAASVRAISLRHCSHQPRLSRPTSNG